MKNAEKYKTARERARAFRDWCLLMSGTKEGCGPCPFSKGRYPFFCGDYARFKWLDLEFKGSDVPKRTFRDDAKEYFEATRKKSK